MTKRFIRSNIPPLPPDPPPLRLYKEGVGIVNQKEIDEYRNSNKKGRK